MSTLSGVEQPAPAGSASVHHFGYLRLTVCEPGSLVRYAGAGDAIAVLVPGDGAVHLVQDGRGTRVESGQLALIDLRRPFRADIDREAPSRLLLFRLPAHALHVPDTALRTVTARALPPTDGVAALLAPLLHNLDESASRTPPAVGERLGGIVTELVAALVHELTEDKDEEADRRAGRHQLVLTIREYIDRHLDDPELSAERIAAAHLISVRYLYRLFEDEGVSVGRLILRRRVEECARELVRRARVSQSIAVVAARWGFRNAAHFSRSFKAVYGQSPQEWRRRVRTHTTEQPPVS
ncbi:helix-turn-helix domain-containing protein [Streptomyces sp. A012304]|uniref:helix-turn-helix domain-containing protein n=1 Tax=Streptomyces sp. A012304 TaxID=375446 RepID=UPI0022312C3A|nr:helix-turn-helix domain-containing protein [Streptomyces sp. A012304]GKQ34091.1 hypothetical protein ALMP_06420 [Streptomyces sp. A012304]